MANGKYSDTLRQPGFFAFFCTQFLGAFNDNFLKIVVSFIALDLATNGADNYVELIAFLFILPSALFSGYAGHLADVYSKRTILVAVKMFEIIIMVLALGAFFTGHIQAMLAGVFLMGLHATFFSPAKYGILPEMLRAKDLPRANGFVPRQRPARDEHLYGDHSRHLRGRRDLCAVETQLTGNRGHDDRRRRRGQPDKFAHHSSSRIRRRQADTTQSFR